MKAPAFTVATLLTSTLAAELDVEIISLTQGLYFTSALIKVHGSENKLLK